MRRRGMISIDATSSLTDSAGASALLSAAEWLQGTLRGTIATTVAMIAVAATGMMMLAGRVDVRRGFTVVIGCFIVFGAASIAGGIQSVAGDEGTAITPPPTAIPFAQPTIPRQLPQSAPYDPYAGASVPLN